MQELKHYFNEMGIETFWYKAQLKQKSIEQAKTNLISLNNIVSVCENCDLHRTRTNTVFGEGNESAKILFIGEAPGRDEDKQGKPFVGRAGKLLTEIISSINLTREDIYIANTVKCRPPNNRNPEEKEVEACSDYLEQQIDLIRPKVIVLLGKIAANRVLKIDQPIGELRKKIFIIKPKNIPTIIFYHPAYILRSPKEKKKVWEDLLFLKSVLKENDC